MKVVANVNAWGPVQFTALAITGESLLVGDEKGVRLSLTVEDAEALRSQLDELLTVYDRHSI